MATFVNIYDVLGDNTLRTAHHIAKGYFYPNLDPNRPIAETNNCQGFSENRSTSSDGDNSGPKQSTRQQRPNWGEQSNKQQAHHRNKISEYLVKFYHTKLFEEVKNYRKNGFPLSLIVFYTNSDFNEETDRAIRAINKFLHLDNEIRLGVFDCSFDRASSTLCYKELGLDSLPSIQLLDGPSKKPFQGTINVEQLEQFLVSYLTNRKVISSQKSWNTFLNDCADDVPCIVTVSSSVDPPLSPAIVARSLHAKVAHVPMTILKKQFPTWKAQVYDQTSNKDVHVLQVVSRYVSPMYVAMAPKYTASDNYDESLNRHNTLKLTLGRGLDLPLYKYCYYVLKQLTMDGVWWVTSFF